MSDINKSFSSLQDNFVSLEQEIFLLQKGKELLQIDYDNLLDDFNASESFDFLYFLLAFVFGLCFGFIL